MISLRHPSIMIPLRCASIMIPLRCASIMIPLRYPSIVIPLRYPSIMISLRYPSIMIPLRYPSIMISLRYPSIMIPLRYPSIMIPLRYPSIMIPLRYGMRTLSITIALLCSVKPSNRYLPGAQRTLRTGLGVTLHWTHRFPTRSRTRRMGPRAASLVAMKTPATSRARSLSGYEDASTADRRQEVYRPVGMFVTGWHEIQDVQRPRWKRTRFAEQFLTFLWNFIAPLPTLPLTLFPPPPPPPPILSLTPSPGGGWGSGVNLKVKTMAQLKIWKKEVST